MREVGAIDLTSYRQLSGMTISTAKYEISNLVSLNIIEAKGHRRKTYYIPTPSTIVKFASSVNKEENGNPDSLCGNPDSLCGNPDSLCGNPIDWIPEDLRCRINNLKKRANKKEIFNIVQELCKLKPLSVNEISLILGRTENHVRERIITPMKKQQCWH